MFFFPFNLSFVPQKQPLSLRFAQRTCGIATAFHSAILFGFIKREKREIEFICSYVYL